MTRAGLSLLAFAGYQASIGVGLLLAPQLCTALLQLPATPFMWRGLLAVAMLILAYLCARAALGGNAQFVRWTLETRSAMAVFVVTTVAAGLLPGRLLLFAFADAAAVVWTIAALRADRHHASEATPMPMQ